MCRTASTTASGDLNDLAVNDDVEVSGYRDSTGAIRATRVEIRGGGAGPEEVKGVVSSLGGSTFQIGSLVVNYAGATLTDFGSDTLSNGDLVEVKGSFAANLLTATIVQREDSESGGSGDEGELEGYITRYVSPTDFDVAGVRVTTNGGTEFEGGNRRRSGPQSQGRGGRQGQFLGRARGRQGGHPRAAGQTPTSRLEGDVDDCQRGRRHRDAAGHGRHRQGQRRHAAGGQEQRAMWSTSRWRTW